MKSNEITENTKYRVGSISQRCGKCQWEASRLSAEHENCPSCGAPIFDEAILKFGGLIVEYAIGNKFFLKTPYSNARVEVDEADVRDTIIFLVKHFKPWN
jgi:hypothetical protein